MRRIGRYWAISSGLLLFAACGGGRYAVSNNNNENNAPDCGNGVVEAEEACDGTALDGWTCELLGYERGDIGCSASCELDVSGCEALPGCGNGVLDPEESCDGSNLGGETCEGLALGGGTLGCTPACRFDLAACDQPPVCGNGEVEYGEACDDGNVESCDGCSSHCRLDGCGNGVVDCDEQCDDGSTQPGDGCGPSCRFEECGNGIGDPGEVCDDGNEAGGDGCSADCLSDESCSNGITDVEAGEQCDDGNLDSGDGCSATCLLEGCGNGILDPFEVCDDGNQASGDGCSADCLSDETCGNSIVDTAAGETCDDGNQAPGDGCSATCLVEGCGNGVLDQGEACDDGNIVSGDGCSADCHSDETCPNGVLDTAAGEECDTTQLGGQTCLTRGYYGGNLACGAACAFDESGCSGQCADGVVDVPPEECDDGNTTVGDGCNASCQAEANVCLVDHDLGVIGAGDTSNVAVSTLASHAAYATTCGGAGGREQVLRFTTLITLDVTIVYVGQTGHHVLGVFRDMSMACDAQQVTCFDTAGSSSGNTGPVTLTAGTYFVVVDANLAGDEGTLQIAVSAAASTEPCIVEFGFDGVYRGCEIPYSYEDISATGTLVGADDEAEWTVSIGFGFNFYGVSYNQVTASTNGALAFNGGYITHYNGCLPDDLGSQQPGIAVLWDDLDSTTGGAQGVFTELRGTAPSRRFIVQWVTEHYLSGQTTGTASFQVVLHETTGHVEMRYLDTDFANASYNAGVSATVGIEAGEERPFVQHSCNQPDVSSMSALMYYRQCNGSPGCVETSCVDGLDNDGDGLTDCFDGDCALLSVCPTTETNCSDGIDNDADGVLDCNDGDCFGVPACNPNCSVGDCCYTDTMTLELPDDVYWGLLSTSDENGGPRGPGYFFDDIEFQVNAGTQVTIETTSADFDTYLYLLSSSCSIIASNDNGGVGTLSRIVATLPTTDVYVIVVTSALAGATGDYDLSLH